MFSYSTFFKAKIIFVFLAVVAAGKTAMADEVKEASRIKTSYRENNSKKDEIEDFQEFVKMVNYNHNSADSPTTRSGDGSSASVTEGQILAENNGFADVYCYVLKVFRSAIFKIAMYLSLFGFAISKTLDGNIGYKEFLKLYFAIGVFYGSYSVVNFILPYSNVSMGCDCKEEVFAGRDNAGNPIYAETGLVKNCGSDMF